MRRFAASLSAAWVCSVSVPDAAAQTPTAFIDPAAQQLITAGAQ